MTFPIRPPAPGDFVLPSEYRQTSATSCINCLKEELACDKLQPCSNCTKIFAHCMYSKKGINPSLESSGVWQTGPNNFCFLFNKPEGQRTASSSQTLAKKSISSRAISCVRCIKQHSKCDKLQPCSNCVRDLTYCIFPFKSKSSRTSLASSPQSDTMPSLFSSESERGILFEKKENE